MRACTRIPARCWPACGGSTRTVSYTHLPSADYGSIYVWLRADGVSVSGPVYGADEHVHQRADYIPAVSEYPVDYSGNAYGFRRHYSDYCTAGLSHGSEFWN